MKTILCIVLLSVFPFSHSLSHQLTISGKFCTVMPGYERIKSPEGNTAPEQGHTKTQGESSSSSWTNTTSELYYWLYCHSQLSGSFSVVPEVLFVSIKYHQRGRYVDLLYEFLPVPIWDYWPCWYNTWHIFSWLRVSASFMEIAWLIPPESSPPHFVIFRYCFCFKMV